MNFKTGDKVRVRSWEEIRKTLERRGEYKGYYFPNEMKAYCGKNITLGRCVDSGVFRDSRENWSWCCAWLESLENDKKKEKEPVKMEKVVVVRGMNEQQVRKYLGGMAESIETVEMPRTVEAICCEINNRSPFIDYHVHGDTMIAVTDDGKHIGVARKHPNDTWNFNVGRALAKARALVWKGLEKELLAAL